MTARTRLPNRHGSESFTLEAGGLRHICTFSRFADGAPAEIFLSNHKAGSSAASAASPMRDPLDIPPFLRRRGPPASGPDDDLADFG
jgi:hypothetical protein